MEVSTLTMNSTSVTSFGMLINIENSNPLNGHLGLGTYHDISDTIRRTSEICHTSGWRISELRRILSEETQVRQAPGALTKIAHQTYIHHPSTWQSTASASAMLQLQAIAIASPSSSSSAPRGIVHPLLSVIIVLG